MVWSFKQHDEEPDKNIQEKKKDDENREAIFSISWPVCDAF